MSDTALEVFDTTMQKTQVWFNQIKEEMNWDDNHHAYRALRVVLHTLRDRLPVAETADLGAQLPMLIRGIFYEGWCPRRKPDKTIDREEFLSRVEDVFVLEADVDPERVTRVVLSVLESHVTEGETEGIKNLLPKPIRQLWPDHTVA